MTLFLHQHKSRDWFCYFVQQSELLDKKYPEWIDMTEPGDAADRFADLHDATKSEVEVCVRRFAETGTWPETRPEVGAMIRVRLSSAVHFAEVLQAARARTPAFQKHSRWVTWFLIDLWDAAGFGDIHGSYENLRRDGDTGKLPILSRN